MELQGKARDYERISKKDSCRPYRVRGGTKQKRQHGEHKHEFCKNSCVG